MRGIAVLLAAFIAVAHAGNKCPVEQETDWSIELLLAHGDCDKFYKCTYGQPVEQNCPPDLLFNIKDLQCDWAENVDCGDRNVPGVQPEPQPEPKPEPEPVPEPEPEPEPQPEPEPEPKPEPEPEPQPEPELEPEPQPEPEPKPEPEPEPEIEIEEGSGEEEEIEFQDNGCPVNQFIHWLLPSPTDCNVFYACVWGEPVYRNCPSGLHFNPVLQVCDHARDAGCSLSLNKHYPARLHILRD